MRRRVNRCRAFVDCLCASIDPAGSGVHLFISFYACVRGLYFPAGFDIIAMNCSGSGNFMVLDNLVACFVRLKNNFIKLQ